MTPQTQFTPGPWSINPRNNPDWHIEAETGYRVATVYMGDSVDRDEFTQANARLIASAPALLAALEGLVKQMMQQPEIVRGDYTEDTGNAISTARAVIAQAKSALDLGSSTPR